MTPSAQPHALRVRPPHPARVRRPLPAPRGTAHHAWLDVLRGGCALLVLLAHVRGTVFAEYGALDAASRGPATALFFLGTRLGHEAVIVFFVLSGYLVGGKAFERVRARRFDPRSYALDRATRIGVPLVPALVLSAAVAPQTPGLADWLGNLAGLQTVLVPPLGGNGPLWSLAYETWFYVLAYAAGRLVVRRGADALSLLLLAAVASVFTRLGVQYLACWLLGALLYVQPHRLNGRRALALCAALAAVGVAGLQASAEGAVSLAAARAMPRAVWELTLAAGAAGACASAARAPAHALARIAAPTAAFSYTLYLTHYPLLIALRSHGWIRITHLDARAWLAFAAVAAACLVSAWAFYRVFERNTEPVRRWLRDRLPRAPNAPAPC